MPITRLRSERRGQRCNGQDSKAARVRGINDVRAAAVSGVRGPVWVGPILPSHQSGRLAMRTNIVMRCAEAGAAGNFAPQRMSDLNENRPVRGVTIKWVR